jgi:hypothetical protein
MHALLLGLPEVTYLVGKREEYAHGEVGKRRGARLDRGLWGGEIGDGPRHRALLAGRKSNDQRLFTPSGYRRRDQRKCVPVQRMGGINNRDLRHYPITKWGILMSLGPPEPHASALPGADW